MIEFYTNRKCKCCVVAKNAMIAGGIEFIENPKGRMITNGYPFFINTNNNKTYSGWTGSLNKLKEILEIEKEF